MIQSAVNSASPLGVLARAVATVGAVDDIDDLDAALDRDSALQQTFDEHALGFVLGEREQELARRRQAGRVDGHAHAAVDHDAGAAQLHPGGDQAIRRARRIEQVEGARVDEDGAAFLGGRRHFVDDAHRDAEPGKLERGRKPYGPGADHEYAGLVCHWSARVWGRTQAVNDRTGGALARSARW